MLAEVVELIAVWDGKPSHGFDMPCRGGPACQELEPFGGGGAGFGGGDAEGLFRVVGGGEGFVAQDEVADDGVAEVQIGRAHV